MMPLARVSAFRCVAVPKCLSRGIDYALFTSCKHGPLPTSSSSRRLFVSVPPELNKGGGDASFKVAKVGFNGSVKSINLKTSELLRQVSIYARDLITLNLTSRQERRQSRPVRRCISAISPRDGLTVLSFGNIRAVCSANLESVFLLDAHSLIVQDFAQELAAKFLSNQAQGEAKELIFLEEVLEHSVDSFNRRLQLYEPIVDSLLDKVDDEIYSDTGVQQLVPLKDSLQSFEIEVKQSIESLTYLLDNDDEMLALLLTEQAEATKLGRQVDFSRHEHVELLLGVYARQLNNIMMEINYYLGRIQSKQEFVALALASYRNRMVRTNVHIGIAGLSMGLSTAVAGFFGMNLVSGLEHSPSAFGIVVLGSTVTGLFVATGALSYLSSRNMQKRASQRLGEIETLTSAMSDMSALDYTVKSTIERGMHLNKEQFRLMLKQARHSKRASPEEVDLLFAVFDRIPDEILTPEDFRQCNVRGKSSSAGARSRAGTRHS